MSFVVFRGVCYFGRCSWLVSLLASLMFVGVGLFWFCCFCCSCFVRCPLYFCVQICLVICHCTFVAIFESFEVWLGLLLLFFGNFPCADNTVFTPFSNCSRRALSS